MIEFGEPGCNCDTAEAHEWSSRIGVNEKTYHLARTHVPWIDEFKCARILNEPLFNEVEGLTHYPLVAHIAGFYLLDYVIFDLAPEFPVQRQAKQLYAPEVHHGMQQVLGEAGRPTQPPQATLRSLSAEAQAYKFTLARDIAKHLRNYLHYAIASELRYHTLSAQTMDNTSTRRMYWGWQKLIQQFGGEQAAMWAAEMFRDRQTNGRVGWDAYYGGESWAQICDVLAMYERGFISDPERGPRRKADEWWHPEFRRGEFSAFEFVDRVASLQHNTGTCLSKAHWNNGIEAINFVLNSHHNSHTRGLYDNASFMVQSMMDRYWDLKNKLNDTAIKIPTLKLCTWCLDKTGRHESEFRLNDKPVPLCRGHLGDLCKTFGCMNKQPYGCELCYKCAFQYFDGVSEDSLKYKDGEMHSYMASPSHPLLMSVCMSTELGSDCDCARPSVYIKDGRIFIEECYLPQESEDDDGKNVV